VVLALEHCEKALETLSEAEAPFQKNLFGNEEPRSALPNLAKIFSQRRTTQLHCLGSMELVGLVRRRQARLLRVRELCAKGIEDRRNALARKEQQVVDGASLVLSTLTNAYFSPLMQEQRFDVVIVEEASMAILPALFYAACLGHRKTIMVGDPCQLPSIVHSDESYVRKVMGRNIFEVAVADPLSSPLVAMLDVQYRMHPIIGDLVSDLFYSGRLKHGSETATCERIAALEPYTGAPLIVLDTVGRTTCHQGAAGQSRVNVKTGKICVDLALQAVASGAGTVAIVTPYVDQARAIRSLLKERPGGVPAIECSTVHRFQGQERDVVILDTVDTDPMRPGVLLSERGPSSQNLINVAISRARGKLVIVADVKYFELRAPGSAITKMIGRALVAGHREILRENLP
jgi:superfamily I DNA and/or RNA helicase